MCSRCCEDDEVQYIKIGSGARWKFKTLRVEEKNKNVKCFFADSTTPRTLYFIDGKVDKSRRIRETEN